MKQERGGSDLSGLTGEAPQVPAHVDLVRAGLRRLAKAAVIISCRQDERRFAMVATAVSELSMDPPSLLICINRSASIYAPLSAGADFCVNILDVVHEPIAAICGGKIKGEDRFALGDWRPSGLGPPVLADAQASFLCRNDHTLEYGTHAVFIGVIEEVNLFGEVKPLIYCDGRYAKVER